MCEILPTTFALEEEIISQIVFPANKAVKLLVQEI